MGMGTFEALPGDELLGPLRRVCRMVVRNVEFTEGGFFIREKRGKGKNKVLPVYARDKLKKHIEMENSMVDQNELYAFSKYPG